MKRKTFYTTVDVDVDCDIEFDDLLELVESCDEYEKEEIRELIGSDDSLYANNLYDEMKVKLLKEAFNKFSLEELQEKLGIK